MTIETHNMELTDQVVGPRVQRNFVITSPTGIIELNYENGEAYVAETDKEFKKYLPGDRRYAEFAAIPLWYEESHILACEGKPHLYISPLHNGGEVVVQTCVRSPFINK